MGKQVFFNGELMSKSKKRRLQRANSAAALKGNEKPKSESAELFLAEKKKASLNINDGVEYSFNRMKADAAGFRGKALSAMPAEEKEAWGISER